MPLLEGDAGDEALRPFAAALRQLPEVAHVWTLAHPGGARVLVRFSRAADGPSAQRAVTRVWAAEAPAAAGVPTIAAIPLGARAAVAYTLVSDKGREFTTRIADKRVVPAVRALRGVRGTELSGAVRPYVQLYLQPTALQNYVVTADRFLPALRSTLERESKRTLSRLLADTTLARGKRPGSGGLPPASLADLTQMTRGTGEPLPEAQVGPHMVTAVTGVAGQDSDLDALFQDDARLMLTELRRELATEGIELGSRNLMAAHRFVLRRQVDRAEEARRAFNARLQTLLAGGGIFDLLVIDGLDGVPWALDDEGRRGRTRTLWLMVNADASLEEVYDRVGEQLSAGGWRAHLLEEHSDTGLLWLLGQEATAGALASSRNPQLLGEPIRALADIGLKARSARNVRTGPQPGPAPLAFSTLNREAAGRKQVPPQILSEILRLGAGPVPLAAFDGVPVWLAMPAGAIGHRNGDLPLGPQDASLTWAELLQLPDGTPRTDRLREDGRPALWILLDSAIEAAGPFSEGFWQTAQRIIEPRPDVLVRPIRLDQVTIEERRVTP